MRLRRRLRLIRVSILARRGTTASNARGQASPNARGQASSNARGQASILIAMMMVTFLLFFAFVVNTGMLVHAKINLQNAADLAAYAGAATQARQLNQIAMLNYEMRRQYKKFLFRYYVVGNMAMASHPGIGGPLNGPRLWSPDNAPNNNNQVPSTCVIFNSNDNFCQRPVLRGTQISQTNPLDAINSTLQGQLLEIERLRQQNCVAIGRTNSILLTNWLYNTDPTLSVIERELGRGSNTADQAAALSVVRGLGQGTGLIPQLLLLKKRIDTLTGYVNQGAAPEGVTLAQIEQLKASADPAAAERTIQAYLSAYETLGENIFDDPSSIVMRELLPPGADGQALLARMVPITARFDAYATFFRLTDSAGNVISDLDANPRSANCQAGLTPFSTPELPMGVYKDPQVQTYYLVRLDARAKVMFSPWGDLNLKAYAAAQPFGSRVGPRLSGNAFVRPGSNPAACQSNQAGASAFRCVRQVPNLPVQASDNEAPGLGGWNLNEVIWAYYQKLAPELGPGQVRGGIPPVIDAQALERAYQAAMAPNPWEAGRYQIPNDLGVDPMQTTFDPASGEASFWAPLITPARAQDTASVEAELAQLIQSGITNPQTGTPIDQGFSPAFQRAFLEGLRNQIELLRQGRGDGGNGFNVVRLTDPFTTRPQSGVRTLITLPERFMMQSPEQARTSWTSGKGGPLLHPTRYGRTGYSVKLVSIQSVVSQSNASDGAGSRPTNRVFLDSETESDLESGALQH